MAGVFHKRIHILNLFFQSVAFCFLPFSPYHFFNTMNGLIASINLHQLMAKLNFKACFDCFALSDRFLYAGTPIDGKALRKID